MTARSSRWQFVYLAAALGLGLSACGDSLPGDRTTNSPEKTEAKTEPTGTGKSLASSDAPPDQVKAKTQPTGPAAKIDAALVAAGKYLAAKQSPDGAWRSETLGAHQDGPSLTTLVAEALYFVDDDAAAAGRNKAADYLAGMVQSDGKIDPGPPGWPQLVYTSSMAVTVLSRADARYVKARDAWLKMLRQHQFGEALGWKPDEAVYGGWGYATDLPRKPPAGQMLDHRDEPNLSATVFALEALRAAGASAKDPAVQRALPFVQRLQNFRGGTSRDPDLDDGGFFFIAGDGDRNKAGVAMRPGDQAAKGPQRFRSYGSTTADGLRCLLACGLAGDHPRVVAARDWLTTRFSATRAPGAFDESREHTRQALYYYYCNSVARALAATTVREVGPEQQRVRWAEALSEQLLKLQQADGSWQSDSAEMKENDPLIATALAVGALAHCQTALASE